MEQKDIEQENTPQQTAVYGNFSDEDQSAESPFAQLPTDTKRLSGTNYLVLYAISLGLLASILSSIASLLEVCFNYIGKSGDSGDDWLSGYTLRFLLWLVANLLIVVPVYLFLLIKSKGYDVSSFSRTTIKVRNIIYGFFMTILGLVTVWSIANIVYSLIVQFAPKDDYSSGQAWWSGVIQAVLTSVVLGITFFYKLKSGR